MLRSNYTDALYSNEDNAVVDCTDKDCCMQYYIEDMQDYKQFVSVQLQQYNQKAKIQYHKLKSSFSYPDLHSIMYHMLFIMFCQTLFW